MRDDAWCHRPARRTTEPREHAGGAEGRGKTLPPDQIHVFDAHRLLVGQVPWAFLAELFVRGVLIYVILVAMLRLMGKLVAGQLSITELAPIVTLGAALGVPMQTPERAASCPRW